MHNDIVTTVFELIEPVKHVFLTKPKINEI